MAGNERAAGGRKGVRRRLARTGAAVAVLGAALAAVLSLAGGAGARSHAGWTLCSYAADPVSLDSVTITACPAFWAEIGQPVVFDFSSIGSSAVTYNLDFLQLEGTDWWKPASHNLRLNGLAPGWHTMRYRVTGASGDAIADWGFIVPGPAPENVGLVASGPSNSKATITWTSRIPAWRTYCSVDGAPDRICRESTGLVLNGLAAGQHMVSIRSSAGPDDYGRIVGVLWDRSDPQGTLWIQGDTPWGPPPLT